MGENRRNYVHMHIFVATVTVTLDATYHYVKIIQPILSPVEIYKKIANQTSVKHQVKVHINHLVYI